MSVHLYTISWNEADMLGFFFRHYDPWVDRYVIYDNGSTDGTLDILRAHPRVEVRQFQPVDPDSFVLSHTHMQNNCWKESRGVSDWVVITAIDEHLHVGHLPMAEYLAACRARRTTLIPAMGFNMISDEFPRPHEWLCKTRTRGAPSLTMCKLSIFCPDSIQETRFGTGRHFAAPKGRTKLPKEDELLLLHYKLLDCERVYRRHQFEQTGLGAKDRELKFGSQYSRSYEEHLEFWKQNHASATDIADPDFSPLRYHSGNRWWRFPANFVRKLRRLRRSLITPLIAPYR